MTQQISKQQQIIDKFPEFFPLSEDEKQALAKTNDYSYIFAIPDSWLLLVEVMLDSVRDYIRQKKFSIIDPTPQQEEHGEHIHVVQIKEKFGELVIYFEGVGSYDEFIWGVTQLARNLSRHIK